MTTKVLALTGPPAAGKSTVMSMLSDMGVPCKSTGDAVREKTRERMTDTDEHLITEDDHWETAQSLRDEHGDAGPTVACRGWVEEQSDENDLICVSDLREGAEVEWLRENVGPTLVVQIDARAYTRSERYVERELNEDEERESISRERVYELRDELYAREERESPYPEHDVTIRNERNVKLNQIWDRLEHLVGVITT